MAKNESAFVSVMKIFFKGIKLYFLNFEKFFKYMAFPIFGQIIGIALIGVVSYFFTLNIASLTAKSPVLDNIPLVFIILLILTLPGFFIFCKAFWDYLIAMAALNSMASTLIEGGSLEDTGMHAELIKRRSGSYIFFILLLSLIYVTCTFPLLWVVLAVLTVFLSLSFQVFALEEDKSAFNAIKTSFNLVRFNFFKTLLLLILLCITTYWLLPGLIGWGFEAGNLTGFFSYPLDRYFSLLPLNELNKIFFDAQIPFVLESAAISKFVVYTVLSFAVTGFTLPLRSICCTNLYKDIHKQNYAGKIAAEKIVKRAKKTPKDDEE